MIAITPRHRGPRWAGPLKRRLGLEPNTLRRPADHVESSILVTILLVFVIGAPLLGLLVGQRTYETSVRVEQAEAARQPVAARLTGNAPTSAPGLDDAVPPTVPAAVQWKYAGASHAGKVRVQPGAKAGSKVTIWVDANGRPVTGQRTRLETVGHSMVMGGASVFGLAFGCWLSGFLVRRFFIHRQLAAWDEDWSAAEPRWSGRTGS